MPELLTHPAIQSAVAPFVVALLLATLLRRFWPAGTGLAIIAGFLVAVWLITGLTLQPLTSTRKIIMASFTLPFIVMLLEMIPFTSRLKPAGRAMPALLLAAAVLWIIWPVVQRQEAMAAWVLAIPVMLFVAVAMVATSLLARLPSHTSRAFSAQAANGLIMAMGTGAVTLIAASALYSQLAFAISAAMGAVILVTLMASQGKPHQLGKLALYGAVVPVILLVSAATVYAKLPLLVLLFLALVPLIAGLPLLKPQQRWLHLIATCLWASIPAGLGIWIAWRAAGPVSF